MGQVGRSVPFNEAAGMVFLEVTLKLWHFIPDFSRALLRWESLTAGSRISKPGSRYWLGIQVERRLTIGSSGSGRAYIEISDFPR